MDTIVTIYRALAALLFYHPGLSGRRDAERDQREAIHFRYAGTVKSEEDAA